MSRALDTVKRSSLLKDLVEVLKPDEMHFLANFVRDVLLNVRVGKVLGDEITTIKDWYCTRRLPKCRIVHLIPNEINNTK